MNEQILIPQAVAQCGVDYLVEHGYRIKMGTGRDEESVARDVKGCSAILLRTAPVTRKVIEAEPALKIVARHGAGYDNIDIAAAEEHGVWATNAPLSNSNSVAECTIGLMLAAAKKLMELSDSLKRGDFFYKNEHKGLDLEGKTLGIIGFGRIGRMVAKKAALGLDMKILAYDPNVRPDDMPEYVTPAGRDDVFSGADFLTLHCLLTDETRMSVGRREFELMKDSAYLINCARGPIVDTAALVEALNDGRIAGAALDVFEEEPPDMSDPIFKCKNVTVTPHIASNTVECMDRMALHAAMEIHRVLSGHKPEWPVNHPRF